MLGAEFVRYLREWQPVHPYHMLIAGEMMQKSKVLKLPLDSEPPTPEQEEMLKTLVSHLRRSSAQAAGA